MKYQLKLTAIAALSLATAVAAAKGKTASSGSVLSLKIVDNDIKFPPSMQEEKTNEMWENWYTKNYLVLDQTTGGQGVSASEEVIKQRLERLETDVIKMPYNQVVRSYIDRYVVRGKSLVERMVALGMYYNPIFEDALERGGLPLELKYIPVIESALNPNAVSPAGAGGLWQFMVATAKGCGMEVSSTVDERRDPYRSSDMAVYYFKKLYDIYGDWSLAIAAYNCGPGNVNKALRRASSSISRPDFWDIYNYLPKETRGYVPAFIAANYAMTYYKEHGISPGLAKKPLLTDTVHVTKRVNFSQISSLLGIPVEQIRILNPQYRTGTIPGSKSKPYSLTLPQQQIYAFAMLEDKIYKQDQEAYAYRGTVEPGSNSRSDAADDGGGNYADNGNSRQGYSSSSSRSTRYNEPNASGYIDYVVRDGDTPEKIAKKYGMNPDDIYVLNDIKPNEELRKGRKLKVMRISNEKIDNSGDPVTSIDDSETRKQEMEPVRNNRNNRGGSSRNERSANYGNNNDNSGSSRGGYSGSSRGGYSGSSRGDSQWNDNGNDGGYSNGGYRGNYNNSSNPRMSVPQRKQKTEQTQQRVPERKTNNQQTTRPAQTNNNSQPSSQTTTSRPTGNYGSANNQPRTTTQQPAQQTNNQQKPANQYSRYSRTQQQQQVQQQQQQPVQQQQKPYGNQQNYRHSGYKQQGQYQNQSRKPQYQAPKPVQPQKPVEVKHTVKEGDKLDKLAKDYGVSKQEILKANPDIKNGDVIRLGSSIKIPGGKKPAAAAATQQKQQYKQQAVQPKQQYRQQTVQPKQQAAQPKQQYKQQAAQPKQQYKQQAAQPKQQYKQQAAQPKQQPKQQAAQPKQQYKQQAAQTKQQNKQQVQQPQQKAAAKGKRK